MTTTVEKSITVEAPISAVYNQWTQFEEFPQFMGGVKQVQQLDDKRLHWVAEIAGVKREWDAEIVQQVPDQKIAWAATEGATNAGQVTFLALGTTSTQVTLHLEYEPEGVVEAVGDKLNIVEKQATSDLEKFKTFIEERGLATGGWRGGVNEDAAVGHVGVEDAAQTRGDSGKAGISPKTVAAGAAVAAAGIAAVAASKKSSDSETEEVDVRTPETETVDVTVVEPLAPVTAVDPVVDPVLDPIDPVAPRPLGTDPDGKL
jgi:uncharacterized membrane protein